MREKLERALRELQPAYKQHHVEKLEIWELLKNIRHWLDEIENEK